MLFGVSTIFADIYLIVVVMIPFPVIINNQITILSIFTNGKQIPFLGDRKKGRFRDLKIWELIRINTYPCSCDFASDSWYAFQPGHHFVCHRHNLARSDLGFASAFCLMGQFSQLLSVIIITFLEEVPFHVYIFYHFRFEHKNRDLCLAYHF